MIFQVGYFIRTYFWFIIFSILFIYLFIKIFNLKKIKFKEPSYKGTFVYLLSLFLISTYCFYFYSSSSFARSVWIDKNAIFNPAAYRLVRVFTKPSGSKKFFKSKKQVLRIINPEGKSDFLNTRKKQNVMLLVVESLSLELITGDKEHESFFPFIKKLSKKGAFFKNHLSGVNSTASALRFILYGQPLDFELSDPDYRLARMYSKKGYDTAFFFGDVKTTFRFDLMLKDIGFDKYFAKEDYIEENPEKKDRVGQVGDVIEMDFLEYAFEKINKLKTPFFVTYLTNYPHPPYDTPNMEENLPLKERMIGNMKYVDASLKTFFETMKKEPWYKNTLFVITADHKGQAFDGTAHKGALKKYRIPLILYHPSQNMKKYEKPNMSTHHLNIYPTLLDYLGYKKESYFGRSVLDSKFQGRAFFYDSETFYLVEGKYFLAFDLFSNKSQLFSIEDEDMKNPIKKEKIKSYYKHLAKAHLQYIFKKLYLRKDFILK